MFEIEGNNTILLANLIEIAGATEVITGEIDDNLTPENDVDLFAVELTAGDTLFADINISTTDSDLDPVLSIFDAEGNLLVQNDDNSFENEDGEIVTEAESFQQFVPIQSGTYYIGISSSQNLDYDPTVAGSGSGDSFGSYSLELSIEEFVSDDLATESNDIIRSANPIELDSEAPVTFSGEIGDNTTSILSPEGDVDLFRVELEKGDILFADINAAIIGSDLDAILSIFDADGNLLVQNDDNSFEVDGEVVTEIDPLSQWIAFEDGTFFIGVSSSLNSEYNPNVATSSRDTGESSGFYSLELSIDEFEIDELATESNDIIRFANSIELDRSVPLELSGEIGDNTTSILSPEDDVDLFAVELEAGDILFADINSEIIGSNLDAVLSIFDTNGELIVQNEDNSFEVDGETVTELDPFTQLNVSEDGTYYIGVSSSQNLEYDPNIAASSRDMGESTGFYNLVLSFSDDIPRAGSGLTR